MQLGQRETRVVVFKYRNLSEMTYHDTKGKKKRSEIKKKIADSQKRTCSKEIRRRKYIEIREDSTSNIGS